MLLNLSSFSSLMIILNNRHMNDSLLYILSVIYFRFASHFNKLPTRNKLKNFAIY